MSTEPPKPLPANLIEGPFHTKKKKSSSSKGDRTLMSGHGQVRIGGEELVGEEDEFWEDVPEHELASLLCRSALNRLLPGNIDAICHDLLRNQSISQSSTVVMIVDTIVSQVLRTRSRPFGVVASPLNAATVSSLGLCALFASRFSQIAPELYSPSAGSILSSKSVRAESLRARNATYGFATTASNTTITAGMLLEQALIRALMDLLDRLSSQCDVATTAAEYASHFAELAEPAFCLSYFISRLHAYGHFRTTTLHVFLTMLIDSNERGLGESGVLFELWLGSLILGHCSADMLSQGVHKATPSPGPRVATSTQTKSESHIDAATAAVSHYFEVLSRVKEEAWWWPARFEIQRALLLFGDVS